MEEADLLKERLQAITDKRRVQEDIAKKRRQIEEEKLKFQYIKKKALREQWLMDGLSQQTEEEHEAMRLQAQNEQQQSVQLQSNIDRMEKEIQDLETLELSISANEEVTLKRLKEVERSAEDIIKELNDEFRKDLKRHVPSPVPDSPPCVLPTQWTKTPKRQPGGGEPKKATFAMEISVEHDTRTGESQVVATATITPETAKERGVKVYDDGRKSVYALHQDAGKVPKGAVGELTPLEVDELLRQATDKKVPSDVQYHQPVYSTPYDGNSRPSTPKTPNKTPRQTPTSSPSPFPFLSQNEAQTPGEESQLLSDLQGFRSPSKTQSPSPPQMLKDRGQRFHVLRQALTDQPPLPASLSACVVGKIPPGLTNGHEERTCNKAAELVSVKARSEGIPTPIQSVYRCDEGPSPSSRSRKSGDCPTPVPLIEDATEFCRRSPFYPESEESLNFVNALPEDVETEPVTMIFMGYKKAEDEEEEEDIQAELIIIGNSDGEEEKSGGADDDVDGLLSYHPEGYRSKVFRPKVAMAKVSGGADLINDTYTNCDDLLLPLKPTFIHKPGKRSPCLDGQQRVALTWRR